MKTTAIIMAAGLGERMRPVTLTTPKPLVAVNGEPMIETIIETLRRADTAHIYVVVGHLKERFSYLSEKYEDLTLIENTEYTVKNNISSIRAAVPVLGESDCFICEGDLLVRDRDLLIEKPESSCYYGKRVDGHSDDWVFETDENGGITRIGVGGDDLYNMVGISYFTKEDAKTLAQGMLDAYETPAHASLYWDEVVDALIKAKKLSMRIRPVRPGDITEIDTVKELAALDASYAGVVGV